MDRQVSISFVAAYATWVVAFGIWVVSWIIDIEHLGQLAIMLSCVAATVTTRLYQRESVRKVQDTLTVVSVATGRDRDVRPLR